MEKNYMIHYYKKKKKNYYRVLFYLFLTNKLYERN